MPLLLTSTCFSLQRVAQCPEVLGPLSARFRDGVHGHPKPSAPGYCVFISGRTSQCVQPTLLTLVVLLETPPLPVPACDLPSRGPPCPSPEGTAVKTKHAAAHRQLSVVAVAHYIVPEMRVPLCADLYLFL